MSSWVPLDNCIVSLPHFRSREKNSTHRGRVDCTSNQSQVVILVRIDFSYVRAVSSYGAHRNPAGEHKATTYVRTGWKSDPQWFSASYLKKLQRAFIFAITVST